MRKAYEFSAKAHQGQSRRSGEPYLQHPLAVAGVLTSLKTDVTAIVAGLLHDTLEDTVATPNELEREFGKDVVHLGRRRHQDRQNHIPQLRGETGGEFSKDGALDG